MCSVLELKYLKSTPKFRSPPVWLAAGPVLAGTGELDALSPKYFSRANITHFLRNNYLRVRKEKKANEF